MNTNLNTNLLDELLTSTTPINIPKLTTEDFKIKNNYYVVTDGNVFNYYPIKVEPDNGKPFLRFEKAPPVILEGLAIINKLIYRVPVQDLTRRIIRKSREVNLEVLNGINTRNSITDTDKSTNAVESLTITSGKSDTIQYKDERGASREIEVEISQAADIAWSNQIRTLLNTISEKEGFEGETWEIEDFA